MIGSTTSAFADEVTKLAGMGALRRRVAGMVEDALNSPRYRRAILRAAAMGGITGGVAEMFSKGERPGERIARSTAGGAVGGFLTGAAYPSWFTDAARRLR